MPASQEETAVAHQRWPLIFQRVTRRERRSATASNARVGTTCGTTARQPRRDPSLFRDRVHEGLILPRTRASGDGERLPMGLGSEGWREKVGYPDLDWPQSLPPQSRSMCSYLLARRLGALRPAHDPPAEPLHLNLAMRWSCCRPPSPGSAQTVPAAPRIHDRQRG